MMRAIASLAPPAAVGTTMVMVFSGQVCACAEAARAVNRMAVKGANNRVGMVVMQVS